MNLACDQLDVQRTRWRRAREALRLVDPEAADLAIGGLARHLDAPRVRLLILPVDPESTVLEFDEAFWSWWSQPKLYPATRQPTNWGYENCPTAGAAVRLAQTKGAQLGDLGEDWAAPLTGWHDLAPCVEPRLLLRREIVA